MRKGCRELFFEPEDSCHPLPTYKILKPMMSAVAPYIALPSECQISDFAVLVEHGTSAR